MSQYFGEPLFIAVTAASVFTVFIQSDWMKNICENLFWNFAKYSQLDLGLWTSLWPGHSNTWKCYDHCISGCMFRAVVLLKDEPPLGLQSSTTSNWIPSRTVLDLVPSIFSSTQTFPWCCHHHDVLILHETVEFHSPLSRASSFTCFMFCCPLWFSCVSS